MRESVTVRRGSLSRSAIAWLVVLGVAVGAVGCAPGATAPSASVPAPAPAAGPSGGSSTGSAAPTAAPAPMRFTLNWTAPFGNHTPIWVAYETGLLREQGLDIELVNVPSTSRVLQVMVAGEIHLSPLDPATSIQAAMAGADPVLVYAMNNRLNFAIVSQPSIQRPEELRDRSLGITRVGSASHTAALVALHGWGLAPDREVAFRTLGETTAINTALEAGQIDAGVITLPLTPRLRSEYRTLIDLSTQGVEYPSIAVGGLRSWITANEEAVRRFGRAFVLATQRAKVDREIAYDSYRKYARIDDPERLEATYDSFLSIIPDVPYVSEPGLARVLDDLARDDPRVVGHQPGEFFDPRYVRELDQSGFIRQAMAAVGR